MTRRFNSGEVEAGFGKLTRHHVQHPGDGLVLRDGKEHFGWYYVDGKKRFFMSSKMPPPGKTIGPGRLKSLVNYMRLTEAEFADLCDCALTGPQYHAIIAERIEQGLL